MHIMRNIRRTAALAVCAVAAATGLLAAAPAQAQSATPHATAATASALTSTRGTVAKQAATTTPNGAAAASSCDVVYWRSTSSQLCFVGTYYDGGQPYRWPVLRLDLRAFANRVWLHYGSGISPLCLTGGYIYDISDADPINIQVSANIAPC